MIEGRKRGVIYDVGHGGGSFVWRIAVPAIEQGFRPDSISTDLHITSMNSGMKTMLNVMSKMLVLGVSVDEVIADSTWHPAREIHHEELGNLSAGSPADVSVLRVERGDFGFTDTYGARMNGKQKFECELTIKGGKVEYDLNGISRTDWKKLPKDYTASGDRRWDGLNPAGKAH
jgi:dihydroorotase